MALYGVYAVLAAGIVFQAVRIVGHLRSPAAAGYDRYQVVTVSGNVSKPGTYRVPWGTTQFEILRVAGVRPTSDILGFDLARQIESDEEISVGTLGESVSLNVTTRSARLEFFLGELGVIDRNGQTRQAREGLNIEEGDRIQTAEKSQAELSVGNFSRVDIDAFAEIAFDQIGLQEDDRTVTQLFHRSGTGWYKMVYGSKEELVRVMTESVSITVGGSGADFMVEALAGEYRIHNMDGLVLVERVNGDEAVNVIAGQSVVVYKDGRPFQVNRLMSEANPTERFSVLTEEKTNYLMRYMPLNILICGVPNIFYLINIRFDAGTINTVRIPATMSVDRFAQGFSTLDQAFLYGGSVFITTLLEQVFNTRITNYTVFTKDDGVRTASALGGLTVDVDEQAAQRMNVRPGPQKLTGAQLAQYASPSISGAGESERRTFEILKSLIESFRTRSLVITALLADQIVANIETNFSSVDLMNHYGRFSSRANWVTKNLNLPLNDVTVQGKVRSEPDLDKTRTMLFGQ